MEYVSKIEELKCLCTQKRKKKNWSVFRINFTM